MVASVYIKDGDIYLHGEGDSFANIGGIAYELGKPLLDFVCYEPKRFDNGFSDIASAFDNEFAHAVAKTPEFAQTMKGVMGDTLAKEPYLFFYAQMFMDFIYTFIDAPPEAVRKLEERIPGAWDRLSWAESFIWPAEPYPDREKRLFRAATDVVALMSENFRGKLASMTHEIELLLSIRQEAGAPETSSLEYLYWLERDRMERTGHVFYLDNPLSSFYGNLPNSHEIVQLYEINSIDDLFRFEFIQMVEHDIYIKKCKNCGHFFIPRGRADTEYCDRKWEGGPRKCSEIGATKRYEQKVAENPILDAYKKAYRRVNSRTRAKKITQAEFLQWSEQARKKRDACLAGELPFEEFVDWLEQGRIRKSKGSGSASKPQGEITPEDN